MSSMSAVAGRLIVLLALPLKNGCTAPSILRCPSGAMDRVPNVPPGTAQSNTPRCSGLRFGAPSMVSAPQTCRFAWVIASCVKPSCLRRLNSGAWSAVVDRPNRCWHHSMPTVSGVIIMERSRTFGIPCSIRSSALVEIPRCWSCSTLSEGQSRSVPVPTT